MNETESRPGVRLGEQITSDYNIVRLLGKGGMGEVYLAEQLRVGRRRVALKVLNRACSEDPELARRFENEAASAGRIQHRNVVMIFESRAAADGQLYVAMEYVDGKTLRDEIAERGALPLAEIVEITRQVCAGLSSAHRLGIVHRDIKPDNVMLARDDDGRVAKILDFGIARLSEADIASRTESGVVMGTPYYMSPEQALGNTGDKIDARSDIYSLGMVVYQMLTGRVAFQSDSWMGVMYKHLNEPPPRPREFRPELGWYEELEEAVLRALEKDRNNRYQNVQEFGAAVEGAYRRALAANPEMAANASYDATVLGVAAPFVPAPTAVAPAVQTAAASAPIATQAGAPGATKSAERSFWKSRAAGMLIGAGVLIVAALAIEYFVRPKPSPASAASVTPTVTPTVTVASGPKPMPPMQSFSFDALRVDPAGHQESSRRLQARYFSESIDREVSIDMVDIPGGSFLMGAPPEYQKERPSESPQRRLEVPRFFISSYEVTETEWEAVSRLPRVNRDLEAKPSSFKGDGLMPVEHVSWWEAVEFCDRLSRATGRTYRLPTEAEWEYACRAGTTTAFHFGETITADLVNYDANYPFGKGPKGTPRRMPVPEGSINAPNAFGLYDMHGNVAEWCLDVWHENYVDAPRDASCWQSGGDPTSRVVRGGSYVDGGDNCRSAVRVKDPADTTVAYIGFRVVMAAP